MSSQVLNICSVRHLTNYGWTAILPENLSIYTDWVRKESMNQWNTQAAQDNSGGAADETHTQNITSCTSKVIPLMEDLQEDSSCWKIALVPQWNMVVALT